MGDAPSGRPIPRRRARGAPAAAVPRCATPAPASASAPVAGPTRPATPGRAHRPAARHATGSGPRRRHWTPRPTPACGWRPRRACTTPGSPAHQTQNPPPGSDNPDCTQRSGPHPPGPELGAAARRDRAAPPARLPAACRPTPPRKARRGRPARWHAAGEQPEAPAGAHHPPSPVRPPRASPSTVLRAQTACQALFAASTLPIAGPDYRQTDVGY